jgi:hypothetical protein
MRLTTVLAVLFAMGHVAIGVAGQTEAPRIPTGTGSLAGQVVDNHSRRPLAEAMVTLQSTDGKRVLRTTTNRDGVYRFEAIGAGEYRVAASHDGYVTAEFGRHAEEVILAGGGVVHPGRIVFLLADGQARRDVNIALERAGSLGGRVTRADGSVVAGALVNALLIREDGGFIVTPSAQVRTNERGEYEIRDVRPGSYQISVSGIDPEMVRPRARPTYFPGTNLLAQAVPVQVEAGRTTRSIDVVMPAEEVYHLSGHVLRGNGGPVEAFLISPRRSAGVVKVADDGAFDIRYLEPGRHTFWARSTGDHTEAGVITVDVGADISDLLVPLHPTGEIAGRVITEDGDPYVFPGAEVVADLIDDNGRPVDSFAHDRAAIGADGRFHLTGLFGSRVLRLVGTQREVEQVLMGKTPIQTITLTAGERIDTITIVAVRR